MSLRDLLASFHIAVDDKELKEAHEHIEGFKETLKTVGTAVAEAFAIHEVKEFVESQIEAGAHLKILSERLGIATDELQAMQLAAGQAGVSTEALSTGLRFLNRNLGEAAAGGGQQAQTFRQLGIEIKDAAGHTKPAGDVLAELADKLATVPDVAKKTQIAMSLLGRGGSELIPLLSKGGAAIEEARAQLKELGGGLSEDFIEKAHEAEAANVRLSFAMGGLKATLAEALFPAVKVVVEEFTQLVSGAQRLEKETNVLSHAVEFFGVIAAVKALGSMRELAKTLGILRPSVLETVGAFMRFVLPAVGIAALFLIFDELYTLLEGGDTVLGRTLDHFFGIGTAAKFARDLDETLAATLDTLEGAGGIIVAMIVTPFAAAYDIIKGIAAQAEALVHLDFAGVAKAADQVAKSVGQDFATGGRTTESSWKELLGIGGMGPRQKAAFDRRRFGAMTDEEREAAGDPFVTGTGKREPHVREPVAFVREPTAIAVQRGGGPHGVTVQQNNTTKVEIHTAADPHATSKAVGQTVATENQRSNERARNAFRTP